MTELAASRLRSMLSASKLTQVAGAHDVLSARLIDQAGFDAIWLSSLGVSTSLRALPDINLLTPSELCSVARSAVARIDCPLVADCEDGYGDVNNAAHVAREFEQAGVAAISLDDNIYPKRNSFHDVGRALVSTDHMQAKLAAARVALRLPETMVIARTEAMVSGAGVGEAISRSEAYVAAGADALIVHAREWAPVRDFLSKWTRPSIPLIAIPTGYEDVPDAQLSAAGCSAVVYANQCLRVAIASMRQALQDMRKLGAAGAAQRNAIVEMAEVHRIVGIDDYQL
jgi:phosphoenolpyruvate phosphomutase